MGSKAFDSTIRHYYIGYRLHLIVSASGVYQNHQLLPGNMHDINYLKQLKDIHLADCTLTWRTAHSHGELHTHMANCTLIGDRAYRNNPLQMELFSTYRIQLSVPYTINQRDYEEYPYERKIQRETRRLGLNAMTFILPSISNWISLCQILSQQYTGQEKEPLHLQFCHSLADAEPSVRFDCKHLPDQLQSLPVKI